MMISINPVPSIRIFTASSGRKCPSKAPLVMASNTQNVRFENTFLNGNRFGGDVILSSAAGRMFLISASQSFHPALDLFQRGICNMLEFELLAHAADVVEQF